MSDSPPLVSIVILSYYWTRYLKEVLESLVGQSYPHLEILLVNNKGPESDQVRRIAAEFLLHAPARALPGFLYRYSARTLAMGLIRDRRQVKLMLKAWGWVIVRLPRLLAERDRRPFPARVGLGD